jgi:hypothetical protein
MYQSEDILDQASMLLCKQNSEMLETSIISEVQSRCDHWQSNIICDIQLQLFPIVQMLELVLVIKGGWPGRIQRVMPFFSSGPPPRRSNP